MTHVLLFDSDCLPCSRAAQAVAEMGITGLELRGLSDPEILARLRAAGLGVPVGPALLSGEGADARLATGWAMRRRLVRLLGWRRATRVVSLVSVEAQARVSRAAKTMSRRRALGVGLAATAGAVASALVPGAASAASGTPDAPQAPNNPVKPTQGQVAAALASPSVQSAIRHWGPITPVWSIQGPPSVLMFSFDHITNQSLFVDNSDVLTALAINRQPGAIHYFTANGIELGSVSVSRGKITIHQAAARGLNRKKVGQFLACIGAHVEAPCLQACETCVDPHSNIFLRVVACVQCAVCAGPKAIDCAKRYLR